MLATRRFNPGIAAAGVITRPVATMQQIAAARPWPIGLGLYAAISLLNALAWVLIVGPTLPGQPIWSSPEETLASPPWLVFVSALVGAVVLVPASTGLLYVVGRWLGGQGALAALLATQAFAAVPNVLLVSTVVAGPRPNHPIAECAFWFSIGVQLWVLVLRLIGIRASLALSTWRATAALLVVGVLELLVGVVLGGLVFTAAATDRSVAAVVMTTASSPEFELSIGLTVVSLMVWGTIVTLLAGGVLGILGRSWVLQRSGQSR